MGTKVEQSDNVGIIVGKEYISAKHHIDGSIYIEKRSKISPVASKVLKRLQLLKKGTLTEFDTTISEFLRGSDLKYIVTGKLGESGKSGKSGKEFTDQEKKFADSLRRYGLVLLRDIDISESDSGTKIKLKR